jgi:2-polyprenyl-6-methoxyphenol hydroxylase-like FAD-dependent oxidoreductase
MNSMRNLGKIPWLNFTRITNRSWHHGNVVLMGDAAHTTHFSIGSGTTLAMKDAVGLADSLEAHNDLQAALAHYEHKRRADIMDLQNAAIKSTEWFESVPDYIDQPIIQFAYTLWKRRGHHPWWRYQLHLATQISSLRRARQTFSAVRNERRAQQRIKQANISPTAYSLPGIRTGSVHAQ